MYNAVCVSVDPEDRPAFYAFIAAGGRTFFRQPARRSQGHWTLFDPARSNSVVATKAKQANYFSAFFSFFCMSVAYCLLALLRPACEYFETIGPHAKRAREEGKWEDEKGRDTKKGTSSICSLEGDEWRGDVRIKES